MGYSNIPLDNNALRVHGSEKDISMWLLGANVQFRAALTPSLSFRCTHSSAFLGGETTLENPEFQRGIFGCIAFLELLYLFSRLYKYC